jgi:hypothetical protein
MGIGLSSFLLAVGEILAFSVQATVSGTVFGGQVDLHGGWSRREVRDDALEWMSPAWSQPRGI